MIDVLIPVFNAEATVRASVFSILAQRGVDVRVVIIDDGSTDRTAAILAEMAAKDDRLVILTKQNGGIVDALNWGLRHCRAELIARLDADDIAYPDRLATQASYLRAHADCVAVGANAWHTDAKGRRTGRTRIWGDTPADAETFPSVEPYILHPFLMVRRAVIEEVGGYRYVLHSEDTDLYWRLRECGRLHNLDAILGEYRIHAGGISSRSVANARVNAATSQLAALSAQRRAKGRTDLAFPRDGLMRYASAHSLREVLTIAAEGLNAAETSYLELAAAAKLIELGNYRKFRFAPSDIATIGRILVRGMTRLRSQERWMIGRQVAHRLRPKFGIKRMLLRWRSPARARQ